MSKLKTNMSTINEQYTQPANPNASPGQWWADPSAQLYQAQVLDEPGHEAVQKSYHESVAGMIEEVAKIPLDGVASVPAAPDGLSGERNADRQLSYDEIAAMGKGHKLHIAFDQDDPAKAAQVKDLLDELVAQGSVTTYKLGQNSGQQGKDATIYVGHRAKAVLVAELLATQLAGVLAEPTDDVLETDVSYTGKVMGRFEVQGLDPEFHQYGAAGFPLRNDDMQQYGMLRKTGATEGELVAFMGGARERADATLRQRYGAFYTGDVSAAT